MPATAVEAGDSATRKFVRDLSERGYDDILILKRETVRSVLTQKRTEMLEAIEKFKIESVRGLAEKLERDPGIVSRDLEKLHEAELIEFKEENGRKKPRIRHKNVFPEPIISEKNA